MNWGFGAFLEEDEKVLRVFRRPLLFAMPGFAWRVLAWVIVVGLVWFFYPKYNELNVEYVWQALAVLGAIHTLVPMWKWYFNALVMTNESLIIVDWPTLFQRKSTQ